MADKPIRLTTRGKHTLIIVITAVGCAVGIAASVILSTVHGSYQKDSYVMAEKAENSKRDATKQSLQSPESFSQGWLFYQSSAGNMCSDEMKQYLDTLVNRWTKGKLTDNELGEQMTDYLEKKNLSISTAGIQGHSLCLFPSASEIPDYTQMLQTGEGIYDFIGVYTDGEYDEEGRLLCYYWEAGVK